MLSEHVERLQRLVRLRLDTRLQRRIDPADVVQDVLLEACTHRDGFFRQSEMSLYPWLRGIALNKLLELHRRHLGTQMRDVKREISLQRCAWVDDSTIALVEQLLGHGTRPSEAAMREEVKAWLQRALEQLNPLDREVLVLKHFEQLTSREAAQALGIEERAAAKRYLRALMRLKEALTALPGGIIENSP